MLVPTHFVIQKAPYFVTQAHVLAYSVRKLTYFVKVADASGKTKAINSFCATAHDQKRKRYLSGYVIRKDTVFAFMMKRDIIKITIPIERNMIAVLIVMIVVSRFFEYVTRHSCRALLCI